MPIPEDEIHVGPQRDTARDAAESPVTDLEGPRSALARGLAQWDLLPPDQPVPGPAPAG